MQYFVKEHLLRAREKKKKKNIRLKRHARRVGQVRHFSMTICLLKHEQNLSRRKKFLHYVPSPMSINRYCPSLPGSINGYCPSPPRSISGYCPSPPQSMNGCYPSPPKSIIRYCPSPLKGMNGFCPSPPKSINKYCSSPPKSINE